MTTTPDPDDRREETPVDTTDLSVVALYLATKGQAVGAELVRRAISELHDARLRLALVSSSAADWWNGRSAEQVIEEVWRIVSEVPS